MNNSREGGSSNLDPQGRILARTLAKELPAEARRGDEDTTLITSYDEGREEG